MKQKCFALACWCWQAGDCKLAVASAECPYSLYFFPVLCTVLLWSAALSVLTIPYTWVRLVVLLHAKKNWELKKKTTKNQLTKQNNKAHTHSLLHLKCIITNPCRHLVNMWKSSQQATCWAWGIFPRQKEITVVSFLFLGLLSYAAL